MREGKGVGYRMSTRLVQFIPFATALPSSLLALPIVKNDTRSRSNLRCTSITANRDRRGGWCSSSHMCTRIRDLARGGASKISILPSFPPPSSHLLLLLPECARLFPDRLVETCAEEACTIQQKSNRSSSEPFSKDVGGFGLRESSPPHILSFSKKKKKNDRKNLCLFVSLSLSLSLIRRRRK